MNVSDYQAEYAAYRRALQRERFRQQLNSTVKANLQPLNERFADLWSLDSIRTLQQVRTDMPAHLETERRGVDALINHARLAQAEAAGKDVTDELDHCEAGARIQWNETSLAATRVPSLIAAEADYSRRRELQARWFDALRTCDDLRAARFEIQQAAWHSTDATNNGQPPLEADSGITSNAEITASAQSFLQRTSSIYLTQLADWVKHSLPETTISKLTFADSLFFKRAKQLDPVFDKRKSLTTYQTALRNLGIRVDRQSNLYFDSVTPATTSHDTSSSSNNNSGTNHSTESALVSNRTRCYPINPSTLR